MNLKDFELQKENHDSYTVGHPQGKSMNIPKAGLSEKAHKLIQSLKPERLDKGGNVLDANARKHIAPKNFAGPDKSYPIEDVAHARNALARVAQHGDSELKAKVRAKVHAKYPSIGKCEGGEVRGYADGTGAVQPDAQDTAQSQPTASDDVAPPDASDVQNRAPATEEPALQQENLYNKAFTSEQIANKNNAKAIGQQGQAESEAIDRAFSNPDVGPKGYIAGLPSTQDVIAANKAKDDALAQAYASKTIDPQHYWTEKGTGNKLAASLGIILSGMGSATTGQPNLALQNIRSAIDNDIDAQKNDQSSAMNAWKMNREALGSDIAANLATKQQALTTLQYQLQGAAASFKGPIAAAQQQALNAHIEQEKDQNRLKMSLLGPTSDAPDPATRVPILVPPERQKDVQDEIKAAQNTASISSKIKQAFEDAAKEVRPMTGGLTGTSLTAFIPGMQSPSQKKFSGLINTTVREKEGTSRAAAFESLNKNMKPEAWDDDSTIDIKRQFMNDYLEANMSAPMAKSYGIDLSKYPSTMVPNTAKPTSPTNSDLSVKWITREGKQLPALFNKAGKFVKWQ